MLILNVLHTHGFQIGASKWLMNKNQDPWNYRPGPWPNADEKRDIEEAFQTFNLVLCHSIR